MCKYAPEKITIKEPFTLEIWAAKDLTFTYFLLWMGLCGDSDRGTAAYVSQVNCTVCVADVLQLVEFNPMVCTS